LVTDKPAELILSTSPATAPQAADLPSQTGNQLYSPRPLSAVASS
jgi:hypothetical protein